MKIQLLQREPNSGAHFLNSRKKRLKVDHEVLMVKKSPTSFYQRLHQGLEKPIKNVLLKNESCFEFVNYRTPKLRIVDIKDPLLSYGGSFCSRVTCRVCVLLPELSLGEGPPRSHAAASMVGRRTSVLM